MRLAGRCARRVQPRRRHGASRTAGYRAGACRSPRSPDRRYERRRHDRGRDIRRRAPPAGRRRRSASCWTPARRARSFKSLALTHAEGKRWLLVGLGARADFTPERARVAAAVASARAREISTRALCWATPVTARHPPRRSRPRSSRARSSRDYRFERHKSATDGASRRGRSAEAARAPDRRRRRTDSAAAVAEAAVLGEAVNRARDLQNRPGNDLTPSALGEHAQALGAGARRA